VIRGAGASGQPSAAASQYPKGSPGAEQKRIQVGEWDYYFKVVSNSCGGDPPVGREFTYAYFYDSLSPNPDGFLNDGQPMRITHLGGTFVGNSVFTWPTLSFDYPIDGGHAYINTTFTSDSTGVADLTESYETGNGEETCSVFLRDEG
jgi:hypothetical protein